MTRNYAAESPKCQGRHLSNPRVVKPCDTLPHRCMGPAVAAAGTLWITEMPSRPEPWISGRSNHVFGTPPDGTTVACKTPAQGLGLVALFRRGGINDQVFPGPGAGRGQGDCRLFRARTGAGGFLLGVQVTQLLRPLF